MKVNISVEIDGKLDASKLKQAISEGLEKSAYEIERTAKELANVDTGELRRSIETVPDGDLAYDIGTNVEYADFIESGTSPHTITGNPILHWNRDGEDHYASSVRHPGNKAYKYMEKALESHLDDIGENISNAIDKVL